MGHQYAGADSFPSDFTIPDDSDDDKAVTFNVAFEALGDRTIHLKAVTDFLINASLNRWRAALKFPATVMADPQSTYLYYCDGFFSQRARAWYQGCGAGSGNDLYRSRNGVEWSAMTSGIANSLVVCGVNNNAASSKYGDILVGSRSGVTNLRKFDYGGSTWSNVTLPASRGVSQLKHDTVNSKWICLSIGGGSIAVVDNAPDTTYVFTNRAVAGTTLFSVSVREPILKISTTGVALFQSNATQFNRSTDGGTTWTAVTPTSAPMTDDSYAWIPGRSEWVMAAADNKIYASADGSSWSVRATTSIFNDAGGSIAALEAFGSWLFCTWVTASDQGGMGFSQDGGATWQFISGVTVTSTGGVGSRGKFVVGDDAILCTFVEGPGATNGNGYSLLLGLDKFPLGALP